jgi:hypothetical protein
MSPYTSAWGHYVTAVFYQILGTSLFSYRLSGIALVIAGVCLISLALKNLGQTRAAAVFPWIIAFFSAAVINHRFAIEINTFHVFCIGLLAWGLSNKASNWKSDIAILAAIVFGVTSHVLFLAPAFALLLLSFWCGSFWPENDPGNRKKKLAGASLILLAGFFLRIHLGIPEKDKSFALLLLATLSLMGVLFPQLAFRILQPIQKYGELPGRILLLCAGTVALFFLLFFSEGSWAAAFFNGGQSDIRLMGWPLLALGIGLASSWKALRALFDKDPRWKKAFLWAALTIILTTAMATKPAPRYFEIPFLMLAGAFALALAHAPKRIATLALLIWVLAGTLQLELNYLSPVAFKNVPERSFRFLFFKDNSADTLSKQKLAQDLVQAGCKFEQVRSSDVRILEPLKFLSLGDWRGDWRGDWLPESTDVSSACRFGSKVQVERKSQVSPLPTGAFENGPFILYTKDHP